jgi:hypothetical protein
MQANVFTLLCGSPIIVSPKSGAWHGFQKDRAANRTGPQNLSRDLHGMSRQGPNKEAAVKQHLSRNPNPPHRRSLRGRGGTAASLLPMSGSERIWAVASGTSLFGTNRTCRCGRRMSGVEGWTDLARMRPEVWAIQRPFGQGGTIAHRTEAPRGLKKLATPQRDGNSRGHFTKKRWLFSITNCALPPTNWAVFFLIS